MSFFQGFLEGQKLFGESISIIINCVLLSIVYIFGIGLTSIFAKLFGNKFLDLKPDKNLKSYWLDLNLSTKPIKEYLRQF